MKKNVILATAIATVLAAPLAHSAAHGGSSVTVYGKAHVDVRNNDVADNFTVNSNSSRLGFKGSEDLGNGMKAVFKYETTVNITDGGSGGGTFGSARNAYAGIAGDFGTVVIGRHDTPAKSAFYAAGNERIGDSIIDLHSSFGFSEFRSDNVIAYIAPKMGDLGVSVALIPGEGSGAGAGTGGNPGDGLADGLSVGITYKSGPIKAGFGYTNGEDLAGLSDATLINIGGTFAVSDMLNVGLQYQTVDVGLERTALALTGEIGLGDGAAVVLLVGNAENDNAGATTDADVLGLGFKKKLSKRTSTYVAYVDGDEAPNVLGNPWVGNGGSTANGSRISVGLVHNF